MSDYTKTVDFAAKDALTTGDPAKVVKGTEINTEFVNIATAIATKANINSPALTGTPTAPTADGLTGGQIANVTYVNTVGSASVPIGTIVMWGGTVGNYPAGWQLCDGSTYARSDGLGNITTPDLRNKFVVSIGSSYAEQTTGGAATHTHTTATGGGHNHGGTTASYALTINDMPAHTHEGQTGTSVNNGSAKYTLTLYANNGFGGGTPDDQWYTYTGGSTGGGAGHSHGIATDTGHTHSVNSGSNVPPYIALAFIMKV